MKTVYTVTASKIKSALVNYLRFKRQMACVSEYSAHLRDIEDIAVLYLNSDGKKQLTVYEIKISFLTLCVILLINRNTRKCLIQDSFM